MEGFKIKIDNYSVYKHTTPCGKVYIGITAKNPVRRWGNGKNYHHNKHFTSAISKYGWDNIKHEILYTGLTKEQATKKEIELIAQYKSNKKEYGYNKSIGGESSNLGTTMNSETRRIMSEKRKGIKLSEETRAKISQALKNRPKDIQYKFSHSQLNKTPWNKGLTGSKSHSYGVEFTDERRQNISKANKGKHHGVNKSVIHIETGIIYESATSAAIQLGVNVNGICKCCRGDLKSYYKQHYKYVEV